MASRRIMVVEDEFIVSEGIRMALGNLGYQVCSTVTSGEKAVKKAGEDKPDLVLMDIVLKGEMDGIEAANRIRSQFNIPVVYLTAYADEKLLERAKIAESFGYILKPFEERQLRIVIEIALYKHKMEKELKESEEKYRSMMESMIDAAYICSPEYRMGYMNPAMIKRTGRDATGEHCYKVINELEEKCPFCVHDGVQRGKHLTTEIVSPKDGRFYHVSHSPIFHVDGSISKMTIYRDITERKRMEEEILKKNKELESFVYTVSHDLKSPLVSLHGFFGYLIEENKDRLTKNSKHMTERIIANIDRMEKLIFDLLELSRVGRISGPPVTIKVKELFEELVRVFDTRLKENNIKLKITAKEGCFIHTDKEQIIKAMDNLITNAVSFMGNTKDPRIELICRPRGKSRLQICVKDNGIGIDPQYHEKIFEIFGRVDPNKAEGTGVGLTLVKKIVEGLGGKVWVESELGKGAEFWVELPISR